MAYLIGTSKIYLFVKEESADYSTSASSHSVEDGADITDHVKAEPEQISVTGMLVGSGYKSQISTIKSWQEDGTLIRYSGEMILAQCRVSSFQVDHSSETSGGCSVSVSLEQVRIAKPAYTSSDMPTETAATVNAGTQSVEQNNSEDMYHTVKSGDTVYALVNGAYKKYGKTCAEIMAMNPDAFSKAGDFRTLKVGARLKMG